METRRIPANSIQLADATAMKGFILVLCASSMCLGAAENTKRDSKAADEIVAVQILLDRANFGPGKLDGRWGEFTEKALARYRQNKGELPAVGEGTTVDNPPDLPEPRPAELGGKDAGKSKPQAVPKKDRKEVDVTKDLSGLDLKSVEPIYVEYTITEKDAESVGKLPSTPPEQAKLKWLPYASLAEAVAERFHTDADFLEELNPGKSKSLKAGDKVRVPNVEPFELSSVKDLKPGSNVAGDIAEDDDKHSAKDDGDKPRISVVITKGENMLEVMEGERMLAAFPVTVGSDENTSPQGDWKVKGVAKLPEFRYDKKMLKEGERSGDFHMLPPGPNNPVGVIWVALNKKGVGIHGTDNPDAIGRNASHGCVRLANWDVVKFAGMVKAGVPVTIR